MLDSGAGTGGPFARFPATPASITASGAELTESSTRVDGVGDQVTASARPAQAAVSGDLVAPVSAAPEPVVALAGRLAGAGLLAGGAVTAFGHDVAEFDTGVDRLNQRWATGVAGDFGVGAADVPADATAGEADRIETDRSDAVAAARSALLAELQREYERLQTDLDGDARTAAGRLRDGPTDAVLLDLLRAGALPATALSVFPTLRPTAADLRAMLASLRQHGGVQGWSVPAGSSSAELLQQLEALRAAGMHPSEYADVLQAYWVAKAAEKAGIDLSGWDPALGADALRPTIEAVYRYYGDLFLAHPELQWAGMANMIGPSFAAGFYDLASYQSALDTANGPLEHLPGWAQGLLPPGLRELNQLAQLGEADIAFYQQTFLAMQKEIFYDQAMMHEAYLGGGMGAIQELADAGLLGSDELQSTQAVTAWQRIDDGVASGDPALIQQGNADLLYREQYHVIQNEYQAMYDHAPTGPAVTYLLGAIGRPSVPGAQSLGEYAPLDVSATSGNGFLPDTTVGIRGDVPGGNLASFDTRWDLISGDTLPTYQQILADNPEYARELVAQDVGDRIEENRLGIPVDEFGSFLWDALWIEFYLSVG